MYTDADGRAFVERQWSRLEGGEGLSLAIQGQDAGRAIGLMVVMVRPQPGVVGVGFWVVPSARKNGYATRAVQLASSWALGPAGFSRVEAWVEPDNVASQRVLESSGFEREGLLRSFLSIGPARADAYVYSRVVAMIGSAT